MCCCEDVSPCDQSAATKRLASLHLISDQSCPGELSLSETFEFNFQRSQIMRHDLSNLAKLPPTILLNDFLNESWYLGQFVDKEVEEKV